MSKLDEVRKQYPQYENVPDEQLAYGLYKKFYSDKPLAGYAKEIGLSKLGSLSFLKYAAERGDTMEFDAEIAPEVGGKGAGVARGALQGVTFGGGDEIVAGGVAAVRKLAQGDDRAIGDIYQQELERERARLGEFREESPVLAYGSEIAGGIATPLAAAKTVKGAMATGAGLGGVSGFLTSEGDFTDRMIAAPVGAAMGAILGGTLQVAGKTIGDQIKGYLEQKAAKAAAAGAKSFDSLKQEAREAYRAAESAGVSITPEAFDELINTTLRKASDGRSRVSKLTPKSAAVIQEMRDEAEEIFEITGGAMGIENVEYLRKLASVPAADITNPAEQRVALIIKDSIDDFVKNLDETKIYGGDPKKAAAALETARNTWSRMRKAGKIDKILRDAPTYAGGIDSGLRNQISSILRSAKQRAQFSKDEIRLLTQIREGTPIGNLISNFGQAGFSLTGGRNVFGGGLASATGLSAGAVGFGIGGIPGAAIGILLEKGATTGVKYVREMSMQQQVELFRDIVANGLASQVKEANPAAYRMLEATAAAVTRGGVAAADTPTSEAIETMTK